MVLPSAVGGRVLAPGSGVQRLALQAAVEETMQLQGTRGMATALCNAAFANVPVAGESNAHGMGMGGLLVVCCMCAQMYISNHVAHINSGV